VQGAELAKPADARLRHKIEVQISKVHHHKPGASLALGFHVLIVAP
jgi:hypothetical protein